ncbi:FtsK/SpoIIIE domain-containing protein [Microbacterium sp. bgisy207]|uniref:FtsK/SpoIIIE domain-containing protein n=1 Tax=Microbacterium sp. bgisy207 TaxID=3413800 RepID=UPI003EBE9365
MGFLARPSLRRMPSTTARAVDPGRSGVPILATAVPVLGAVGLWALTGSVLSLWFAALAPMLALAAIGDRRWAAHRARRRAGIAAARSAASRAAAVDALVTRERDRAWRRSPDIRRLLDEPGEVWRAIPGRQGYVLLGCGDMRVDRTPDLDAPREELTEESGFPRTTDQTVTVPDAPVAIPLQGRIEVAGAEPLVAATVRAIVTHACLVHPPGDLEIVGEIPDGHPWIEQLPHRFTPGRRRLGLVSTHRWDFSTPELDAVILVGGSGIGGGGVQITVGDAGTGIAAATVDTGETCHAFRPQLLSELQARAVARSLRVRVAPTSSDTEPQPLASLLDSAVPLVRAERSRTLATVIGQTGSDPFAVDLVSEGPHALVVGTTGSGKSELLRTWVAGMAARFSPAEVVFVLADFKGGTAFSSLRALPHVTGVLTDLDEAEAARGLESLRAEVRRRESALAAAGIRDIGEGGTDLARLVVVVDEFATLLAAHPELAGLFVDLAARGRALGIHIVLGTQRATGVFRDALLANCALRIVLRAADAADSRLMIGDDTGARIPARGARAVGSALVKRAHDDRPVPVRVAMVGEDLLSRIAGRAGSAPVSSPWLEPLPDSVTLPDPPIGDGRILVGLADEPQFQRQRPVGLDPGSRGLCVIGAGSSGVTTALWTVATQYHRIDAWVDAGDPESAWDDLTRVAAERVGADRRGVVVVDAADALLSTLPLDYANAVVSMLESIARTSRDDSPLLLGAERLTGPLARVADLLPHRLLLRHVQRPDFLAHGGRAGHHDPAAPPGRGRFDGTLIQTFRPRTPLEPPHPPPAPRWQPASGITPWVTRATPGAGRLHTLWQEAGIAVTDADEALGPDGRPELDDGRTRVLRADPEQWQRQWTLLMSLRAQRPLLIDPSCAGEYRLLTGRRELPPLCVSGVGRGWLVEPGREVRRVRLG